MTDPSSPQRHNCLDSSSLDPLATSIGDGHVDAQTFIRSSPARLPRSSPTKAMRIVEDISFCSPHGANRRKSNAPNSSSRKGSYQNLSPWRIRVTVEAQPEEMGIPNTRTTTRTMKVPLREESPSTDDVKSRGRRSQAGSSGTKRRSTPVRGARSTSRSRRQSVTDLDITVLGDEEDLNEWSPRKSNKKGRPRSKRSKGVQAHEVVPDDASNGWAGEGPDVEQGANISEDLGFEIRPDSDAECEVPSNEAVEENSPELRKIDLNRVSVRSRSRPPKGPKSRHKKDNSNTSPPAIQPPTLILGTRAADSRSTASAYPTPTPSVQDDFEDRQNLPGDPTEHHEGFDTILESEGFTMIDIESIPSARNFVSPPSEQGKEKGRQVETPADESNKDTSHSSPVPSLNLPPISSVAEQTEVRPRPTAIPSYLTLPEGESDLSSTIPSSPPAFAPVASALPSNLVHPQRRVTPVPYSSPRLPSPPRATAAPVRPHLAQPQKSTPPKLARVVKAGIALQGVLSPKTSAEKPQANGRRLAQGTPRERLDDLFEGFDSGTRRELRAGLRFGEELAKRQKSLSPAEIEKEPPKPSSSTDVWRGETTVQHTPITLPANTSDMVPKRACPNSTTTSLDAKRVRGIESISQSGLTTPVQANGQVADSTYPDTQAKEREWQFEREAVSRQIQNANTSQVIIISSDGIDEDADRSNTSEKLSGCRREDEADDQDIDETCGDIWLAEAEAHNSSHHRTDGPSPDLFPTPERERQRERAREVVNKPRRSLIPSPWKRGEDIDGGSTFMTNGDVSGLLWKQPSSGVRFGAGVIKRQQQGKSDVFGSGSHDTPPRLRESSDEENPFPALTRNESAPPAHGETAEEEALGIDNPRLDESVAGQEEDVTGDLMDEGACQTEDHEESDAKESDTHDEDLSSHNGSSLPPQPIKIPVNFNDSTMSAPPLTPLLQTSTPQSSRPSTPRSALKGSRSSLGVEDNSARKVVFSSESLCVDESGQKSNSRIHSLSPTPPPSTIPGVVESLQPALPPPTLSKGIPEPEPEPEPELAPKSWFGWLFGSNKASSPNLTPPASLVVSASCTGVAGVDGTSDDAHADPGWVATKSSIVTSRRNSLQGQRGLPSFLRPPSYPSDPARDVSVPLATSGEFTDVHFRTLHIIYRKSLRRNFHAPDSIRPRLQKMVGEKFSCEEGEYGYFAWEVDQDAVVVLQRFMMEVELGWEGKGNVNWEWSEKELCGRLFRIIVGEEVRREQSWRRGQEMEQKKKNLVVSVMA